ncbi:ATP-binding protein [Rhodococcus tukisamuensis]|uniref:Predicted ATPase n=1 Tax=Rhodococcus tukisamuensis TaxID=168276 RepID=A0A1G6X3E0_9NOCA|nr:AAA family ATPase [Rhodococcus tukisamuensis]SDD72702.1 Predicted ATPase [Rhodococcus tukisamuensis]
MLHVSLLGEQAITDTATGTAATRSPRAVALVAFLAVHAGTPQPRQRIAELFWPDSADGQALTNLRRELHHLRRALGDADSLVVTSTDLCWRDSDTCRVDVRAFDLERRVALAAAAAGDDHAALAHARAAIAAYRGEFLPGGYDDWLLEARAELERQCVDLCDLVCAASARGGDPAAATEAARRRIRLQPLEEVGYRTLMRLQVDAGDRAGALSTYHRCASVLERELGVAPEPATRQAAAALLATPADAPRPAGAVGRSGPAAAEFVGRARELGLLRDRWRAAAAGHPGIALVGGGAGVGKTRLLREVAALARSQGAVVAATRCFGASGRLPLAPVADWLRNPAIRDATATLDPLWRDEVDRLVPSGAGSPGAAVVRPRDPGAGSRAMVDAWQRLRFFEGLARALIGDGRPLLLVVDNLQWCDQETLTFVAFLLGLTTDTPLLVAAALRDENHDPGPDLGAWTARMRATGLLTELDLSPLDVDDTARLAEATAGRPLRADDLELLQAATGGFPLYVVEAMRTAAEDGETPLPVGDLTTVLRTRLEHASPAAREVAGLAAAVGRNFTLDLLTEASDLDADTVVRAVDELWRRRILHEFRDGYDFSHDLLRDAAYAQVGPPARWLLHRRLAQGLELLHSGDTDSVSAQLAEQYARGGRAERAVAYYRRAAEVASGTFAHAEAIRLHREALAIVRAQPGGRGALARELDILESMAAPLNARYGYSSPQLQHTLERSIELAEVLGRRDSTVVALVGLWTSRFVQGDTAGAHRAVSRALTLVDSDSDADSQLSGSAHFAFAGSAVSLGRPAEALHHFELAAELTRGAHSLTVGTRPDVHSLAWSAHAHWLLGHDDDARSSCRDAVALARGARHPYSLAVALAYGGITLQMLGDRDELRDTVGELQDLCDRFDFAYYREWALILGGWSEPGPSGIPLARRGLENLRAAGSFARMPYWLSLLADLSMREQRPDAARATLDAAVVAGQARSDLWWLPEVMRLRAAHDDPDGARTRLRAAAAMASEHGSAALLRRCERDLEARGVRPTR